MTSIATGDQLARRSIDVLKQGQMRSGAFVASPSFPTYQYAWLRDGAFCARALDVVAEVEAAGAFHRWVARSIEAHRALIENAVARIGNGDPPAPEEMPPARYTLDGSREPAHEEPWPNFQVDGYGMWLWSLSEHLDDGPPPELRATVALVGRYLAATWRLKSFSCWEEFDGGEHASTLGAAFAGLFAAARLLDDGDWAREAERVRLTLLERFVHGDRFGRGPDDERVDGSLLWLGVPFAVLPLEHPLLAATVAAVKRDLYRPNGGVYRYRGDSYYGGGEWILLACSLGWHELRSGHADVAEAIREWVWAQARVNGDLPEQVSEHAQKREMIRPWVERWGPVATPLLWSHAMYLITDAAGRA